VPVLTVTSRLASDPTEYNKVKLTDFDDADSKVSIPLNRRKKYIVLTARVHPGESNSSWMMHGFIKAIVGNSFAAQQLRKRIVFKIIPMLNVDGVIAGNYRASMAGADLNRRYLAPDARLHPEVCAVKELIGDLRYGPPRDDDGASARESRRGEPEFDEEDILCMLDMHGHSRKKNVFIYGPQYALSSEKYYRSRVLPKLLSEETTKFRYHSCQFKYEHAKRKTARIVLNQEFDIMNCFTLEASFHAYFDASRSNFEFTERDYEDMGEHLVAAFYEYCLITEEEERRRELIRMQKRKRRRV
jgi:cytosolic carboxypeptidase protein 2/3